MAEKNMILSLALSLLAILSSFCLPLRFVIRKIRAYRVAAASNVDNEESERTERSRIEKAQDWIQKSNVNCQKTKRSYLVSLDDRKSSSFFDSPGKRRRLEGCRISATVSREIPAGIYNFKRKEEKLPGNNRATEGTLWRPPFVPKSSFERDEKGSLTNCVRDGMGLSASGKKARIVREFDRSKQNKDLKIKGFSVDKENRIPRNSHNELLRSNTFGEHQLKVVNRKGKVNSSVGMRGPLQSLLNVDVRNSSTPGNMNTGSSIPGVTVAHRSRIPRRAIVSDSESSIALHEHTLIVS
jgi:hypothetical protein